MLALSIVMYAVSAAHWALSIVYTEVLEAGLLTKAIMIEFAIIYLPSVNYLLSDVILLWQAWVLWNRRFLLFIPPLISLVCTLGTTVASGIYLNDSYRVVSGDVIINNRSITIRKFLVWSVAFSTIGTNLWATGLIFIRAWQHRRLLRSLGAKGTFRSNTEKTLAFLVESGALYLCIWIVYLSTSVVEGRPGAPESPGVDFFNSMIVQFVGMYPTMIVVVVAMQLSTADILSHPGAEAVSPFVFRPLSPGPQLET